MKSGCGSTFFRSPEIEFEDRHRRRDPADGVSGDIDLKGEDEAINVRDADGQLKLTAADGQVRVIGFKGDLNSQTADGDVFLEGDFQKLTAKAGG